MNAKSSNSNPLNTAMKAPLVVFRLLLMSSALLVAWVTVGRRQDAPAVWREEDPLWTDQPTLDISVVMPFYNPGAALRPTVERMVDSLREAGRSFEVIAVSDGSTDGSEKTIEALAPEVRVIESPENLGKGAALHRGFALAGGEYVGFVDSDGDIDPAHLVGYLATAKAGDYEVVFASKRHPGSNSSATGVRKVISQGFIWMVKCLFALNVCDTQTGCKLFRRDALAKVLPNLKEQRFAFDLEFFVAARAAGVRDMLAQPVELKERMAGSTVSRSTIIRTLADALTVLGRLHLSKTYSRSIPVQRALSPSISEVPANVIPFPVNRLQPIPAANYEPKAA